MLNKGTPTVSTRGSLSSEAENSVLATDSLCCHVQVGWSGSSYLNALECKTSIIIVTARIRQRENIYTPVQCLRRKARQRETEAREVIRRVPPGQGKGQDRKTELPDSHLWLSKPLSRSRSEPSNLV